MSSSLTNWRSGRRLAGLTATATLCALWLVWPALRQPALARAAWQARVVPAAQVEWSPGQEPAGYARPNALPATVAVLQLADLPAAYQPRLERLLDEIALGQSPVAEPVDARRLLPYRGLMQPTTLAAVEALGNAAPPCCSDYTEALTAHGLANGITVREWQSAEHTMAEVWAPDLAQWIAVDLTANRYWVDPQGRPLSFAQLGAAFASGTEPLSQPISRHLPQAPVEPTPEAAWYARVLPSMGLVAGDDDPQRRQQTARIPLRWPYNQVIGGLLGIQHPVWIPANRSTSVPPSFWQLRWRLHLGAVSALLAAIAGLSLVGQWLRAACRRRAARRRQPTPGG